ncbi:MAG: hypothetical protein F6J93_34175 [Oscillatoria sp. SIO1A7]|nr:hypothetical protein [Oscillatoria sp. SIO1A7]
MGFRWRDGGGWGREMGEDGEENILRLLPTIPTPYTLHPTPHTLHPTLYTPHPTL